MREPTDGRRDCLAAALARIAPSPPLLVLSLVAAGIEAVLLRRVADNIYQTEGWFSLMVVPFLIWYWLTISWIIAGVSQRIGRLAPPLRTIGSGLWLVLLAVAALVYAISWGFYFQSGQFLNGEAIRFFIGNFHVLWVFLQQAEGRTLLGLGFGVVIALAAMALLGPRLVTARWRIEPSPRLRWQRRCAWYGLGLFWLGVLVVTERDDMTIIIHQGYALRNSLNPGTTLAISAGESLLDERIEPCLTTAELQPREADGWWTKPIALTNRLNVVIVTIESMRHDVVGLRHQGQEVMPHVNALAQEAVTLTCTYAPATQTDYSTAALFSSLHPLWSRRHRYFREHDPWPKVLLYDVLKQAGYATAMISSQDTGWGGMDHFLRGSGLDLFYDPATAGAASATAAAGQPVWANNIPDSQTVTECLAWLQPRETRAEPFFLAVNLQSSHFPYALPAGATALFQPARADLPITFLKYDARFTEDVRNAYYNALHEADQQLGRLLANLRETRQWDRTIVVVCGDHGQAFNENGYVTHGREPVEPVAHTACVVRVPGLTPAGPDDYPVSLIDLPPTILGRLGLPPVPNFQGIDVLATNRPAREQRCLFLHAENPVARAEAVVWAGRWKYLWNRKTKSASLYDVVADPAEQHDQVSSRPELAASLRQVLTDWRRRQLAYYHYPAYYGHYYPPATPTTVTSPTP